MPTAEEFDEFYISTRRELLLQTFALTGDLVASRAAVRDAYVAARHHWEKLGRAADPMLWVRPRAWARAQRRHTARPWHRERHIDEQQTATLVALHELRDHQRRTLVLAHLTDQPMEAIAREVGVTLAHAEDLYARATEIVTEHLDCTPADIGGRISDLGPAVDSTKLPRPSTVRRSGLRRRRNFAVAGSAAIVGVVVGAGNFVAVGSTPEPVEAMPVRAMIKATKQQLLTPAQAAPLAPGQVWRSPVTTENNDKNTSGKNTACQRARFADTTAFGAAVRTFTTASGAARKLVEAVEISQTPADAAEAFTTTLGWYAGCQASRVRLTGTWAVGGVGDVAVALQLNGPDAGDPSFLVGVARTGQLTVSTVLETKVRHQSPLRAIVDGLATAVAGVCTVEVAGACNRTVTTTPTRPGLSGETPGMLAVVDLPAIADVDDVWVGAKPEPANPNRAATICDKADFIRSGAKNPISRSFVFLKSGVPGNFGVSETIGRFPSARAAIKFTQQVTARMKACPDRILSSTISTSVVEPGTAKTPPYAYWRLTNQLQNRDEVVYWMGVTRVGPYVAQVTMTPVRKYDVSGKTFAQLLTRSRDRLFEVS